MEAELTAQRDALRQVTLQLEQQLRRCQKERDESEKTLQSSRVEAQNQARLCGGVGFVLGSSLVGLSALIGVAVDTKSYATGLALAVLGVTAVLAALILVFVMAWWSNSGAGQQKDSQTPIRPTTRGHKRERRRKQLQTIDENHAMLEWRTVTDRLLAMLWASLHRDGAQFT